MTEVQNTSTTRNSRATSVKVTNTTPETRAASVWNDDKETRTAARKTVLAIGRMETRTVDLANEILDYAADHGEQVREVKDIRPTILRYLSVPGAKSLPLSTYEVATDRVTGAIIKDEKTGELVKKQVLTDAGRGVDRVRKAMAVLIAAEQDTETAAVTLFIGSTGPDALRIVVDPTSELGKVIATELAKTAAA